MAHFQFIITTTSHMIGTSVRVSLNHHTPFSKVWTLDVEKARKRKPMGQTRHKSLNYFKISSKTWGLF